MILYPYFAYKPGACGISDVLARILAVDPSSMVLCHHSSAPESSQIRVHTETENHLDQVPLEDLEGVVISWLDHEALPWEENLVAALGRTGIPRIWWVHEAWHASLSGYSLTAQQYEEQRIQKERFRRLVTSLQPTAIATTNKRYQHLIAEGGYPCEILPNTGTIPIGSKEDGKNYVRSQITDRSEAFVVVSLGNLILNYWDWQAGLKELESEARRRQHRAVWVILGTSQQGTVSTIRDFVQAQALEIDVRYPGDVSSESIDHWLWGADAGMSGHPYAVWEKSTGFLAMTERNLPVFVPRMGYPQDAFAKPNPCLFPTLRGLPSRESIVEASRLVSTPDEVAALARGLLGLTSSIPSP